MRSVPQPRRLALVLSGGGARGAYEAGVLSALFEHLPKRLGAPLHFDIITGTSVGAVHACYIAAAQGEADIGPRLIEVWKSLSLDSVFGPSVGDLIRVPLQLLGFQNRIRHLPPTQHGVPERIAGLFDTGWLERIVLESIDWKRLRQQLDSGALHALAVSATEIATGRSAVFVDAPHSKTPSWSDDPFIVSRPTEIGPAHALASAAIPLVFPALRIDRTYYCDGGLRLNTPLSPALRLGADRVLVIGLRFPRSDAEQDRAAQRREANYSNPTFLAGKALNALILDRIEHDLDRLRMLNTVLRAGTKVYGDDFLGRIQKAMPAREEALRIVDNFLISPSKDIGIIASDCLEHQPRSRGIRDWLSRNVVRFAGNGALGEADLLSYLFFDSCFAGHLVELGRRDAKNLADKLADFLA